MRWRPSLLSLSVALIVGIVAVVGFALTERNTSQQEQDLLQSNANQAAAYASQVLSGLGETLASAAAVVKSTDASPAAFESAEHVPGPLALVLVKKTGATYTVTAASGSGFQPGQVLTGPTLATVQGARSTLTAGPVTTNKKLSTARFAMGAPTVSAGYVIYEQFTLNPYTATPVTTGKPFAQLNATLYGPGAIRPGNLLISTSSSLPLSGPKATASVPVGSSHYSLVASARSPFIGGFAKFSSLALLVLGLLLAFIIGVTIEILHRRQRYSKALVDERTAELERSLKNLEEAQDALVRGERLTAIGEMAGVVGHELRNPLAAVINALYLIRSELAAPMTDMLSRNLAMAEREAGKAATLADDLTAFVRPREMDRVPIPVAGLVDEVLSVTPLPPGVALKSDVHPCTLVADRGQMAEVLTNLVTNAYQAMPAGGVLGISVSHDDEGVHLVVEDSGTGIDDAVADRVFEPFFTTKYNGTGLGLAIVHRLVVAHGGVVDFENVPSGGARVTLLIPDRLLELTST
ncbi:MAG TPA: HAMP domain-containing sensor histidine kinase [Acidimicrobiales bacterium]